MQRNKSRGEIFLQISHVSITEPSSPIDWREFSETGFSTDVTREREFETV